ncbi:unnamed protein product, partial [Effrenium voratum]
KASVALVGKKLLPMGCQCVKGTAVEATEPRPNGKAISKDLLAKKVSQAKTTRVLALRECGLKSLPEAALTEAAGLRTVDLSANQLKALPANIGQWTSLQNFLCGENAISELPASLGQLVALQKLVMSSNKLSALPKEISSLSKVKVLMLDCNNLGPKLPADVFAGPLSESLEELDLTGNGLEELPSSVARLSKLVRLVVCRNKLSSLPPELAQLSKLQHLDAAENSLTAIPEPIIACPSLNELWLKGNPVDRLQLQATPGFGAFLERRKQRLDARIGANVVGRVDLSVCGLE